MRRIIFHQNMHNHQKSQIESRRGAVHFFDVRCYCMQRVIDDIYVYTDIDITGQHINCFQHFQSYKEKNLA